MKHIFLCGGNRIKHLRCRQEWDKIFSNIFNYFTFTLNTTKRYNKSFINVMEVCWLKTRRVTIVSFLKYVDVHINDLFYCDLFIFKICIFVRCCVSLCNKQCLFTVKYELQS